MDSILSAQLKSLPDKPGVYIMKDREGSIIYIGKAKNLKNRVSQYFHKHHESVKTYVMVSRIHRFEYIVTDTELEALVLECSLIKKHMPKYNILLKDSKGYSYIKITMNEDYPRIMLVHRMQSDGAKYFGPFLSKSLAREIISAVKSVFSVRTCSRNLPKDIGKGRVCLNYHIKQCSGPCQNFISREDYRAMCDEISAFLDGKYSGILEMLTENMEKASQNCEFERAAKLRDKIKVVERMQNKQKIISMKKDNNDIIAVSSSGRYVCVQIFFVRDGKIAGRDSVFFATEFESLDNSDVISDFIKQYYSSGSFIPSRIFVSDLPGDFEVLQDYLSIKAEACIKIVLPKRGDKFRLLEMVRSNADEMLSLELIRLNITQRKTENILKEFSKLLLLENPPHRIEAYDISNISGASSVGVYVVFHDGIAKKSEYRKFNINSVSGPDDYKSMGELLYRRLENGVNNLYGFGELPDVILIDGGKGHVSAAAPVLDHFGLDIPVFGMVKNEKHRTDRLVSPYGEVSLKPGGSVFNFITRIQDEVHRFAVSSHKKLHAKHSFSSDIKNIKGIGEKKHKILLEHFKNTENIKKASVDELAALSGISYSDANNIYNFFNKDC